MTRHTRRIGHNVVFAGIGRHTQRRITHIMDNQLEEQIKQYLRDNLRLDSRTDSVYNGGFASGGTMYDQRHSVQLILDGEIISEVTL